MSLNRSFRYFDIVKNPMDLSKTASKLKGGEYRNRQDFAKDFKLIIFNAKLYNPAGSQPHEDATKIEDFFNKCMYFIVVVYLC
jgi:transcription initiation factor TFIID subunit 2